MKSMLTRAIGLIPDAGVVTNIINGIIDTAWDINEEDIISAKDEALDKILKCTQDSLMKCEELPESDPAGGAENNNLEDMSRALGTQSE